MSRSFWIGYDPREAAAFAVARHSANANFILPIPVYGLVLDDLRERGLYTRPTERRKGRLYDVISEHEMATEFAISRFLVPHLVREHSRKTRDLRVAAFIDCDMLVRHSLEMLYSQMDPQYAVMVVKHDFRPTNTIKMDGQVQSQYGRKNWSSVMLFNVDHPANDALTPELVNSVPGRDLHRFCWLKDEEIGELQPKWNYLVGHHTKEEVPDPCIVHYTDGIPLMAGYEDCEYADEFVSCLANWAKGSRN